MRLFQRPAANTWIGSRPGGDWEILISGSNVPAMGDENAADIGSGRDGGGLHGLADFHSALNDHADDRVLGG
jgi:hypothetical protein